MANLNFKYGASYNNLPATISNGTIYVTKNEKAMYVDLDDTRIRLGQTIVYPTWTAFSASETLPPQSPEAFYYIEDQNALLKYVGGSKQSDGSWSGGYWNQINSVSDIQADLSKLEQAVAGLQTTATAHGSRLDSLEAADIQINAAIAAETKRAQEAEQANTTAIADEANRATGEEARIEDLINGVSSTVNTHTNKISTLETKVGNAASGNTAATGLYKVIADEASRAIAKEGELANSITSNFNNLQGKITDNDNDIAANSTAINDIKANYVKTETYNNDIETIEQTIAGNFNNLQGQITDNDTDISNLRIDLTQTTKTANDNTTAISGLNTTVTAHGTNIQNLQTAVNTVSGNLTAEANRAKGEESRIEGLVTTEANRAKGEESRIEDLVSANDTAIKANKANIDTNTTNITNLSNFVGSLPSDTEAETIVGYIQEQFAAANAMTYQGGISSYEDLPTTDVEAGFTYIVLSDFVYGGKSYYAGDLVVAAVDQTGATYNGGWTHVNTGYSANQENKLVRSGNGVQLQSYAGTNLGSLVFASAKTNNVDQFKITTANTGNATTVTLSMEWGTF